MTLNFKTSFSYSSDREYDCDYESQHCAHSTTRDARYYCFRGEARPECVICHQFIGLLPTQTETLPKQTRNRLLLPVSLKQFSFCLDEEKNSGVNLVFILFLAITDALVML